MEFENPFTLITSSIACYKRSQELNPNPATLKRLGNVYNEIGNTYNNLAAGNFRLKFFFKNLFFKYDIYIFIHLDSKSN